MNKKPTVSIVTICYNAAQVIEKTICSVLAQTYTDYEYVFVDGASKDETVSIIEAYREQFEEKGVPYRVTSEPDQGIYDAMNKGAMRSDGEWVIMLNAGDVLVNQNVLQNVFGDKTYTEDVVYGNTVLQECCNDVMLYKLVPARSLESLNTGMVFCHQSVFVRGDTLRKYLFDTSFKIVADYDLFVRLLLDGVQFKHIETYISVFDGSGVSMANPIDTLREYTAVREKAGFATDQGWLSRTKQKVKYSMRRVVRTSLPWLFYAKQRGWHQSLYEILE